MSRFFSRPIAFALFTSLLAFVLYLTTVAPSVGFIDSGELATVCSTLGIAHPTGYPLFTLIGWTFAHLPIASTVIFRLNLMAALFTALGAGALVIAAFEILKHWIGVRGSSNAAAQDKAKGQKNREKGIDKRTDKRLTVSLLLDDRESLIGAIACGLAAAASTTWWSQSTGIEVYPVQLFLIPLVITFFLRMLRKEAGTRVLHDGRLFALILGLSFANHMTTVLLAPAMIYAFFARYGFGQIGFRRIGGLALPFILGLAVYLYLPIRSSMYPFMDWGHPTTLSLFLKHVTGGQYKIWMFANSEAAGKNWRYFWHELPHEFTILGAAVALLGIYGLIRSASVSRVNILLFTLLLFFGCLFYSINYSIHDIDSYFLLAYLSVALWIGCGVALGGKLLLKDPRQLAPISIVIIALLAGFEVSRNYSEVDESGNHMVEDYTKNMLSSLPPNAIIFSTQWDFWVSGAFYYQLVEGLRPDVLVIDKAMLRDRPWIYEQLERRAPAVVARVRPEMDNFLRYLKAFDNGDAFNESEIAPAYQRFTTALVSKNQDRPIFVAQDMIDEPDELFAPGFKPVPAGMAYRLLPSDTARAIPAALDAPKLTWRDQNYRKRNYYTDNARLLQSLPLAVYADQLYRNHDLARAKSFVDEAMSLAPDSKASLDDLSESDRSFAEMANQKYQQIEALRQQIIQSH